MLTAITDDASVYPFVSLWIDHAKVGCGWRGFFVATIGRKSVTLFYPPLLATVTVPMPAFLLSRPIRAALNKRRMKAQIRTTARTLGFVHPGGRLDLPTATARAVMASL